MTIYSIAGELVAEDFGPIDEIIVDRPETWQGLPLEWISAVRPPLVFLQRFDVSPQMESAVYLFGVRYELSEATLEGGSLGDGFFVEYVVAQPMVGAGWKVDRLLQHASVTYADRAETSDYVGAKTLQPSSRYSLFEPPKWEAAEEAVWPLVGTQPMHFVGQVSLPENEVTRNRFTWGVTVYLFASHGAPGARFKVVEQEQGTQSAAEHYTLEEDRAVSQE